MKLATIYRDGGSAVTALEGENLIALDAAFELINEEPAPPFLWDMRTLLEAGEEAAALVEGIICDYKKRAPIGDDATIPLSEAVFAPPIINPNKIICIGLNYRDHCIEQNRPFPERPILFSKFATALTGHRSNIIKPKITDQLDFEGELAFIIRDYCHRVEPENAMSYIAGYSIFHDVSAREIQFGDKQWLRGKTFPTFAPMGPFFVTSDEIENPNSLALRTTLNGRVMQDSNTSEMIFDIPFLLSFISRAIPLFPGDIVATGTPAGVGVFRKEPIFMTAGDEVEIFIEDFGTLSNTVVDEE